MASARERLAIAKLDALHDLSAFDYGEKAFDDFLVNYALVSEQEDASRTYVGLVGENTVVGFSTLAVGAVSADKVPERLKKGLASYPIPIVLLARLAVDQKWQRKGIGAGLLRDAVQHALQVAEIVGVRAMVFNAKDSRAKAF
ncbi:GNAT family N-acetyltransferase [Methylacidimicrobium sp. B4]|uniref:GNAT family N-acetyltransferase n=1 Tax=Methylacidimicrobium sp. B4 TaxID=2796139 RepID=UPI001A8EA31A|nr:GNAT family N-acetyltransferase [Methylacidimicrobium sp. B4]QSR84686.1 GNAT family N-acetyltransferase [Methylacidimicrobium sp. B4]